MHKLIADNAGFTFGGLDWRWIVITRYTEPFLPPTCATGQEIRSTVVRTLMLPGGLSYSFPANYEFAEPWDSPRNSKRLAPDSPVFQDLFQCPSAGNKDPAITNYVAVVGANTMWPGCDGVKKAADGSDKDKILLIEVINSDIHWNEPRDLTLEQALDSIQPKQGIGIGSHHKDGIHYVTVGGEIRTLDPNIDRESLRKLLVRDSPEVPASLEPKQNGEASETGAKPSE